MYLSFENPNRKNFFLAIAIILISLLGYVPSLNSPFVYDDTNSIVKNVELQNAKSFGGIVFSGKRQKRIIQNIGFFLDWKLANGKTWPFHLQNLIWHGLCSILVFFLLVKLFPNSPFMAYFGLFLFCMHPLQHQSVVYIMGRITLIQAFFYFLALNLLLYRPEKYWFRSIIIFISFFAKESCLLLPFFILVADYIVKKSKSEKMSVKEHLPAFAGLIVAIPLYFLLKDPVSMYTRTVGFDLYPFWEHFFIQGYYHLFYVFLFLNPAYQSLVHHMSAPTLLTWIMGAFSYLIIFLLLGFLWRKKKELWPWCILFVFTLFQLAPTNTILQMINPFAEYRLYGSNLLLISLLVYSLSFLLKRNKRMVVFVTTPLLVFYYAYFNYAQQKTWQNTFKIYDYALQLYPESARAYFSLGVEYTMIKSWKEAEENLLKSIALMEGDRFYNSIKGYYLLGVLYMQQRRYKDAYELLHNVSEEWSQDKFPPAFFNLKLDIYRHNGKKEFYEKTLITAQKMYPDLKFLEWE